MTLPQHILDEPTAWKAAQMTRDHFLQVHDRAPSIMEIFAAGAEWQKAKDAKDVKEIAMTDHAEQQGILAKCESCGKNLYKGDQYFACNDGPDFCADHAPTIADIIRDNKEALKRDDMADEDQVNVFWSLCNMYERVIAGESQDTKVVHTL